MKKIAAAFLVGLVCGGSIVVAILFLSKPFHTENFEALDYVIDEWTKDRTSPDSIVIAQLAYKSEFDFKLGVIPDTVRSLARRVDSLYHVPAAVTISQWVLESRFGVSDLTASAFFGHTARAVAPFRSSQDYVLRREKVMENGRLTTGRAVAFAKYSDMAECFDTHGRYISGSKRYANAFTTKLPEQFARELSKAGYATDPEYALKLVAIMRRYKL